MTRKDGKLERTGIVVEAKLGEDRVGFSEQLEQAKQGDKAAIGVMLEWYCNYLTILASTQLDQRLRRRVSPSDLVQETLLAAHRDFADFRGQSERELIGWLRQILIHRLHHIIDEHVKAGKRDIRREVSIEQICTSVDRSAANYAKLIPARTNSPSSPMHMEERAVAISNELAKLPQHYRDVIVFRNLQGHSFEEIAKLMDRSVGATRMLWLRALEKLKEVCEPIE